MRVQLTAAAMCPLLAVRVLYALVPIMPRLGAMLFTLQVILMATAAQVAFADLCPPYLTGNDWRGAHFCCAMDRPDNWSVSTSCVIQINYQSTLSCRSLPLMARLFHHVAKCLHALH